MRVRFAYFAMGLLHGMPSFDLPSHSKEAVPVERYQPTHCYLWKQGDIANLCLFGWYEWVYYRDHQAAYLFQKECLGGCLGPAKNEGYVMMNWILTLNGTVIPCRSIQC